MVRNGHSNNRALHKFTSKSSEYKSWTDVMTWGLMVSKAQSDAARTHDQNQDKI
jgi:hypothetical protein